jgi:hypothetical protein
MLLALQQYNPLAVAADTSLHIVYNEAIQAVVWAPVLLVVLLLASYCHKHSSKG